MYTIEQINAALRRFLEWSSDDNELREGAAALLENGEIELAAIVDGEFIWRLGHNGATKSHESEG